MSTVQVINISHSSGSFDKILKAAHDNIIINIENLVDEKADFSNKIGLHVSKNQVIFSHEVLQLELNRLNSILKQSISPMSTHFLYKDLIELENLDPDNYRNIVKVYDPETGNFLVKRIISYNAINNFPAFAIGDIIHAYYFTQMKDSSLQSIYRVIYEHNVKLETIVEYGIGTLEDLFKFFQEEKCIYDNFLVDLKNELSIQLEILHSKNICHRDLRPRNIIITQDFKFKISEFGFCMKFNKKGKQRLNIVSSPDYMSDEHRQAYELNKFAFICPFEEDKFALEAILKETFLKTKKCTKVMSKMRMFNDFDSHQSLVTFQASEHAYVQEMMISNLEKRYWTKLNKNLNPQDIAPDKPIIKYAMLVCEKQGAIAYEDHNYALAIAAYEKIRFLLTEHKVYDYRGYALIRYAEIQRKIGDFLKCLELLKMEEDYLKLVDEDSKINAEYHYLNKIVNSYKDNFERYFAKLNLKTIDEIGKTFKAKILSDIEPKPQALHMVQFDINYMTYVYFHSVKDELEVYEDSNQSDNVKALMGYCYDTIGIIKELKFDKESSGKVFETAKLIRILDENYQYVTEYTLLEVFEQAKVMLKRFQTEYQKEIIECDMHIGMILSDLSGELAYDKTSFELLKNLIDDITYYGLNQTELCKLMHAVAKSAPLEEAYQYQQKVLYIMTSEKLTNTKAFFDICLEIIRYHNFYEQKEILDDFKKNYLDKINKDEWPRYWEFQIAIELNLQKSSKKEIEEIVKFYLENEEYPFTNIVQLIECWTKIKAEMGDKVFVLVESVLSKQESSGNFTFDKVNFFCIMLICLESLRRKDSKDLFAMYCNHLNAKYKETFGQKFFSSKNVKKNIHLTKNLLYVEIFEYFNRVLEFPNIDLKEFYLGVYYANNHDFARACAHFEIYHNTVIKKLSRLDHPEILTFIEYVGELIITMHELSLQNTPYCLTAMKIMTDIFTFAANQAKDPFYKDFIQGSIQFYLFNFDEAKECFSQHIKLIENEESFNLIESLMLFRWCCLLVIENKRAEAEKYYDKFKVSNKMARENLGQYCYYWHRDFYNILELEQNPENVIQKFGGQYLREQRYNVYAPEKTDPLKRFRYSFKTLKLEFKNIILNMKHCKGKEYFTLHTSDHRVYQFESVSKWTDRALDYFQKSMSLPEHKLLEIFYLNCFSKLNIFNQNNYQPYHQIVSDFKLLFSKVINIHKKYSTFDHAKALDDFKGWVFVMLDGRRLEEIKNLFINYSSTLSSWQTCPLALPSLLDEWRNLFFIAKNKVSLEKKYAAKGMETARTGAETGRGLGFESPRGLGGLGFDSPRGFDSGRGYDSARGIETNRSGAVLSNREREFYFSSQYVDFINYNRTGTKKSLSKRIDKTKDELNKAIQEYDDYDDEIAEKHKLLYLLEKYENPKHGTHLIDIAYKILEPNSNVDDPPTETVFRLLNLLLFYFEPSHEKIRPVLDILVKCLGSDKLYYKHKFAEYLMHFEPVVEQGKISFKINIKESDKIMEFLLNDDLFEDYSNDDDEFFSENKMFDILFNHPVVYESHEIKKGVKMEYLSSRFNIIKMEELKHHLRHHFHEENADLMMAFLYQKAKNYSAAILEYMNYLKIIKKKKNYDPNIFVMFCLHIAHIAMKIEAYHVAITAFQTCLKRFPSLETQAKTVEDEHEGMNESAIEAPNSHFDEKMRTMMKFRLAFLYSKIGKYDGCFDIIKYESLEVLEILDDSSILNQVFFEVGYYYYTIGEQEKMEEYMTQAIEFNNIKDNIFKARFTVTLVASMVFMNKSQEAMLYLMKFNRLIEDDPKYKKEKIVGLLLLLCMKLEVNDKKSTDQIISKLIQTIDKNSNVVCAENVIGTLILYHYYKDIDDKYQTKQYSEKFKVLLERYFRTKIQVKEIVEDRRIPDHHLEKLREVRLGEIFENCESVQLTTIEFIDCYKFLRTEWQKWNYFIFQRDFGIINAFLEKPADHKLYKSVFFKDMTDIDEISEYPEFFMRNALIREDGNLGDYVVDMRKTFTINDNTYVYYKKDIYKDVKPKEDSKENKEYNEFKDIEETCHVKHIIDENKEVFVEFKVYKLQPLENKERLLDFLEKLKNPVSMYMTKLLDYSLEETCCRLIFEKCDYTLVTLLEEKRTLLNERMISGERILRYIKEIIIALLNYPTEFDPRRIKAHMVGLKNDHVKLNFFSLTKDPLEENLIEALYDGDELNYELMNFRPEQLEEFFRLDPYSLRLLADTLSELGTDHTNDARSHEALGLIKEMRFITPVNETRWLDLYNFEMVKKVKVIEDLPPEAIENIHEYEKKTKKNYHLKLKEFEKMKKTKFQAAKKAKSKCCF